MWFGLVVDNTLLPYLILLGVSLVIQIFPQLCYVTTREWWNHGPTILFSPLTTRHVAKLWHSCGKICGTRLTCLLVMLKKSKFLRGHHLMLCFLIKKVQVSKNFFINLNSSKKWYIYLNKVNDMLGTFFLLTF